MSKKTTEPTEPPPDPDDVIAAWLETARIGIAKDLDIKIRWSTLTVATMRNAARSDVDRALSPPPLQLPRPSRDDPLETTPPARTQAEVDRWRG